jgi:hypothetical protein
MRLRPMPIHLPCTLTNDKRLPHAASAKHPRRLNAIYRSEFPRGAPHPIGSCFRA